MNRRFVFLVSLTAFCLPLVLLASCATELTDDSAIMSTASAATSAAPTRPPSVPPNSGGEGGATLPPQLPSTHTPPPEPTTLPTEPPPAEPDSLTHTVQKGDTLLGLARKYGVPMAAIQLRNGMGDSTVVQVGQVLSIPPQAGWEGASSFWVVHVVKAGETLVGIARTYGLKAATLKAVNGLADADLIRVGQELVLPLDAPAVPLAPTSTTMPVPSETEEPIPPPTPTSNPTADGLSASPTPDAPSPSPTAVPAAPPPSDVVAAWPHETVRLINAVRAQHGLGPLAYNETLARAAQAQANDCAQRGWCSHTGSDGSNIKTRILRAGYEPASWAECWAQRKTPQGAVDIWMDEVPPNDPHRRTLLTTWLSEIGVGVAQTDWGYYFIADFGRP